MDSPNLERILIREGFAKHECDYFTQTPDERPTLRCILNNLLDVKCKYILDIGCGPGVLEKSLTGSDLVSIIGLDLNKRNLKIARLLSARAINDFVLGDASHLPFRGNSFGAVVAHDVFADIRLTENIVAEMVRSLENGGEVYFDLPNRAFFLIFPFLRPPFPEYITYSLTEVCRMVRRCGTKVGRMYVAWVNRCTQDKFRIPFRVSYMAGKLLENKYVSSFRVLVLFWPLVVIRCNKVMGVARGRARTLPFARFDTGIHGMR